MSIVTTFRVAIGLLLLSGGVFKVRGFREFVAALDAYAMFGAKRSVICIGLVSIAAETVIGALLVSGWLLPWAIFAALSLFGIFSLIVVVALLRRRARIDCGCMMIGMRDEIGWHVCLRNVALACLLIPSVGPAPPLLMLSVAVVAMVVSAATANLGRVHNAILASDSSDHG